MFSKSIPALVLAAALAACLAACSPTPGGGKSEAATETASFGVDSFNLGAPVFVAQEEGYFADQNIEATTTTFQTGVEGIQAVLSGQLDFGFAFDFAAVSSVSSKVVILGSVDSPAAGFHQMFFGAGIANPEQLAGGKVGVLPGTAQEYITGKWIEKNGLEGKVETVALPGLFEMVSALKTEQIQAGFLFADGVAQAKEDANLTRYGDDEGLIAAQGIYLMTLRDTVEKRPQVVEGVLRALDASTEFMTNDPVAAAEVTAEAVKGDATAIESSLAANQPGLQFSDGQLQNLLDLQAFLTKSGKVPADTDIEGSLYLDPAREIVGDAVIQP